MKRVAAWGPFQAWEFLHDQRVEIFRARDGELRCRIVDSTSSEAVRHSPRPATWRSRLWCRWRDPGRTLWRSIRYMAQRRGAPSRKP